LPDDEQKDDDDGGVVARSRDVEVTDRRPGRTRPAGWCARLVTLASLPLLALSARRLLQLERTPSALAEQSQGETLATLGVGMLVLGGVAWLLDRRRPDGSRAVTVLACAAVLWPAWILFVHWYDGR
jgi:hypothetical protein